MTPARIGVVTTSYPREPGDPAGHFVAGFARWLAAQGPSVEVIAAGPGAPLVDGIRVARIGGRGLFYDGGAPDALTGGGAWIRAAAFQLELAASVARRAAGWDAIVSHWLAPSGIAVALAIAGRPRPHLAIAHSSDVALLRRSKMGRALVRRLAARADLVYSARHLVLDGAPGRVVAMGIDPPAGGERARGRRRFLLQRTTALFLGRLVPVKGLDLLLRALPDDLDLLVAGEGPMAEPWRAAARPLGDRVRFLGEVRGEAKRDLLAAADLLCLPSLRLPDGRTEGAPTVLAEALAAGLPIVATRESGAAERLVDGETGFIVAAQQAELRAALARLAGDPSLRERFSRAAREAGRAHLWPVVGPALAGTLLTVGERVAPCRTRNGLRSA